ncbi:MULTISPECIES: NAD-dependent epimerase/dehydratase family protein [Frankia]|uniref:NAD-dependent epimerase/dehydratase family protein n=1 Tax=Frankia TaxID=1854 RepID=UPI000306D87F|nr:MULTISPECIES: NAD(P)-dependent oxidoreductase [Frankia]
MVETERILVTGAAGRIGQMLRPRLTRPGRTLRLLDIRPVEGLGEAEEFHCGSVTDLAVMEQACAGVDVVIHLGAIAEETAWEKILDTNINGTYTVFEAARRQGVPRVIFASSNHAVGFYPRSKAPAPDYLFPMPDTYYGVSKAAGEALGSLYSSRYGMDVICLRIQCCFEKPHNSRMLATWLSPDDAGSLFEAAISVNEPGYRVVWGVSANTRAWFTLDEARSIGFEPADDAEDYLDVVGEPDLESVEERLLGGEFCGAEYDLGHQVQARHPKVEPKST